MLTGPWLHCLGDPGTCFWLPKLGPGLDGYNARCAFTGSDIGSHMEFRA